MVAVWWLATEKKTDAVLGGTCEDEATHLGGRGIVNGGTSEVVAVAEGERRGIIDEVQGAALILALVEGGGVVG